MSDVRGRWLLVSAHALALVGAAVVLFAPLTSWESSDGTSGSSSLVQELGSGEEDTAVLVWACAPIVLTFLALIAAGTRADSATRWVTALLLLAFCSFALLSIGVFFLPTALALVGAAIVAAAPGGPTRTAQRHGAEPRGGTRLSRVATISFARGIPGPDLLPTAEFGACAQRAVERDGATALNYGPPGGYPPLREWIAGRHGVDPERVVITNGSLQGFRFVARHFAQEGARFFVEAPCYDRSLAILRGLGVETREVELAEDGLDVAGLEGSLRAGDVVYTIPTFQNPSGRTLSRPNRERLLELVRARGATLLEDDPYGELRFEGEEIPRLLELARDRGDVLFLSSFSKTVAPGIRTGYLILPEELVASIESLVLTSYVSPAIFVEAALYEFVEQGLYEPNLERVREGLRVRRDAMLTALARELRGAGTWNRPDGGYFLWLDLPAGVEADTLLARAGDAGVTFVKGSDFYLGGGGEAAARLAFSYATADEIETGVERLASLVRDAASVAV